MRKLPVLTAAVLVVAGCATVPSGPREMRPAEQVALGRRLTADLCGGCHSTGGRGASPNRIAPAFRDLHQRMDVEMLGEGLATGLLTGHPAMPVFRLEPYEVVSIIRYLRSIQPRGSQVRSSR